MTTGVIGTSIWQQNMQLLERLTIDRSLRPADLARLRTALDVDELVYLATCNRVEFIYSASSNMSNQKRLHRLIDFFFRGQANIPFFPNDFYHFTGREAITHLFRTTSSLESLVVGETQITGQIKQALQDAQQNGLVGPQLGTLINEALMVAKRVKRDTSIGVGALSMASLAAMELRDHLCTADNPAIALVGSGAMTQKLANYLVEHRFARLLFVNRTLANVTDLAAQFGCPAIALDDFRANPPQVDAIFSATASVDAVFGSDFLGRLAARPKPIVCVDLAVPRDFSVEFAGDSKVSYIDIPLLKTRGNVNLRQKFVEAGKANDIVRDAVTKFLADRVELSLKPIFHDSYQESLALAQRALDDMFAKSLPNLDDDEKQALHRLVSKLVGNAAFQPVKILSDKIAQSTGELHVTNLKNIRKEAV